MKMRRRRAVWRSSAFLVVLYLAALGADLIAPYEYSAQYRDAPYRAPTRIRFVDPQGRFHLRPFVLEDEVVSDGSIEAPAGSSRIVPIRFLVESAPRRALLPFAQRTRLFGVDEPARLFLLGTDGLGRDVFSRLVYGARVSLLAGLLAAAFSLALGLAAGSVAGFYGGSPDEALMRLTELFLALPWLYLLFAVRAVLPLEMEPLRAFLVFVAIVGGIGWARPARLFRGVAMAVRQRDFLLAARGSGGSDAHLLRHHVLPQCTSVLWTQFALLVPRFILAEVTLSFLGLGVSEPMPSWGNMLASLRDYHVLVSYGWMFAPGVALLLVVLCFQSLANALQVRLKS